MKIYIDNDYMCRTSGDDTMREYDVSFFDGKCVAFIEGYRYVPQGETWIRADGVEFSGQMISPWRNARELEKAQLIYEKEQAEEIAKILLGTDNPNSEVNE